MTCIHSALGLCQSCQADYDTDPTAYIEFGDHPAGIARWQAEQAIIEASMAESVPVPTGPDIPY